METIIIQGTTISVKIRFRKVTDVYFTEDRETIIIEHNNGSWNMELDAEEFDIVEVRDAIDQAKDEDLWNDMLNIFENEEIELI
jgi:hypothetical protein